MSDEAEGIFDVLTKEQVEKTFLKTGIARELARNSVRALKELGEHIGKTYDLEKNCAGEEVSIMFCIEPNTFSPTCMPEKVILRTKVSVGGQVHFTRCNNLLQAED